ncbi:MAG: hypothetical protein ACE5KZ_13925 [Candidatus Scalinduaceae bacterium]
MKTGLRGYMKIRIGGTRIMLDVVSFVNIIYYERNLKRLLIVDFLRINFEVKRCH